MKNMHGYHLSDNERQNNIDIKVHYLVSTTKRKFTFFQATTKCNLEVDCVAR